MLLLLLLLLFLLFLLHQLRKPVQQLMIPLLLLLFRSVLPLASKTFIIFRFRSFCDKGVCQCS